MENTKSNSLCNPGKKKRINSIKVLGMGCRSCHEQYTHVQTAVKAMKLDLPVEYITDLETIMSYGDMRMPAIVVNEQAVSMGKLLTSADFEKLLGSMGFET